MVELNVSSEGFLIEELFSGRKILKIPIHQEEYYLIEYRRSDGSFYNRNIPRDGLLIWHIDERADNDQERHKRVDLVCADGLFADKGFPRMPTKLVVVITLIFGLVMIIMLIGSMVTRGMPRIPSMECNLLVFLMTLIHHCVLIQEIEEEFLANRT